MMSSMIHSFDAASAPIVSVVVPCYNAARTIAATIESVQAQTMTRWELHVVDDGSSDGTPDLVREMAAEDRRIRLTVQVNSGPSAARNRGAELARGGIIAFLDADDVWTPEHLELHVAAFSSDARLGVSFSPCEIMDDDGCLTGEQTRIWYGDVEAADLLGSNPTTTCSALVVRRKTFMEVGPMRRTMKFAEDQEWLFRVAYAGWRIRGVETRTVRYRTSPGGLSGSTERMLEGWYTFIGHARVLAPTIVESHIGSATARIHLYHARRAIRTGQGQGVVRKHIAAALEAAPMTVFSRPVAFAALCGAAVAPQAANQTLSFIRSLRHG